MYILGIKIDNMTMKEVLETIEVFLNDGQQHYIVTPNPEMLVQAQKDEEFKKILNEADLAVPDGFGLLLASKFLGQPLKERVTGVDLIYQISNKQQESLVSEQDSVQGIARNRAEEKGIFLLGGINGVAIKAAENLTQMYPGLKIVGTEENIERGLISVNQAKPDILLVAFGAPKQEKWIYNNLKKMPSVKVAIGVGGAFDFISGRIRRAPLCIQKIGLEWFWRLLLQPRRIKRVYNAVIKFPLLILKNKRQYNGYLTDI